jgi:hypothetical protein
MIKTVDVWVSTYQDTWEKVFKDAQGAGFNATQATTLAWQKWNNDNAKEISCISPIASAVKIQGSTNQTAMAPLDFSGASSAPQSAQILASAWKAWASSIIWTPPPPAPPFSAIASVIIDQSSLAAAYATLLSGLIAEMAIIPPAGGAQTKYQAMGNLFYTAAVSLKVMFNGSSMSAPPAPLVIPMVPVL